MGWHGEIRKRSVLEAVAAKLSTHWQRIVVWRWRDHDRIWVSVDGKPRFRMEFRTPKPTRQKTSV